MIKHESNKYLNRILDQVLDRYLKTFGAVLIQGAKWCGKTTTAMQKSKTNLKLQDPRSSKELLKIADIEPIALLDGQTPILIDEWQMAPVIWDTVRAELDERNRAGQFILTGSAVPSHFETMHSGTGRIARLIMRPMSLLESKESTGMVSLRKLFDEKKTAYRGESNLTLKDLAFAICRGGWPSSLNISRDNAHLIAKDYVNSLCEVDISRVDGIEKSPSRAKAILRSYARNISSLASNKTILDDVKSNDMSIAESTLYAYLNAFKRLFVIDDVQAWNPSIRSKTVIRASNKRGFVDPSLAVAALGATYQTILNDLETFGFLFESLCLRDLKVYLSAIDGEVFYYRDRYGLECDAVLMLSDGQFGLVEIKLGEKEIETAAQHLTNLAELISKNGMNPPRFMMILTGGKNCYRRTDGVIIVPIGALGP